MQEKVFDAKLKKVTTKASKDSSTSICELVLEVESGNPEDFDGLASMQMQYLRAHLQDTPTTVREV